jgi:hypothetical protein
VWLAISCGFVQVLVVTLKVCISFVTLSQLDASVWKHTYSMRLLWIRKKWFIMFVESYQVTIGSYLDFVILGWMTLFVKRLNYFKFIFISFYNIFRKLSFNLSENMCVCFCGLSCHDKPAFTLKAVKLFFTCRNWYCHFLNATNFASTTKCRYIKFFFF